MKATGLSLCPKPKLFRFVLLLLLSLFLKQVNSFSQAVYATGGSGVYRNDILWLTWGGGVNGTNGVTIANGSTNITTLNIGGSPLVITTTVSAINVLVGGGGLKAYRSGIYTGDGFDNLYNIGGTGTSNQLIAGIANSGSSATVQFSLTINATLNGNAIDIPSVVMADAEASTGNSGGEYIYMQSDATASSIERIASCTNTYNAVVANVSGSIQKITLAPPTGVANCPGTGPDGIVVLNFNSSAYQSTDRHVVIDCGMQGRGTSALAIGISLPFDLGDAPASYGVAAHLIPRRYNNNLPIGTTNINTSAHILATQLPVTLLLGANIDADANSLVGNAAATSDDNNNAINDEDGVSLPAIPNADGSLSQVIPSYTASVTLINTTGADANLVGWIDWDNNGVFDASEAVSATIPDGSTSAILTWNNVTLSGTAGVSGLYSRFRLSSAPITSSTPTGAVTDGEVEDYLIPLAIPLPVGLTLFEATATTHCSNLIAWKTSSETNSKIYEIEYSMDGNSFSVAGKVESKNAINGASYQFEHPISEAGMFFYRLKSVDQDGTFSYSKTVSVNNSCVINNQIAIYPNPVTSSGAISGLYQGDELSVFGSDGRRLMRYRGNGHSANINFSSLSNGLYFLEVIRKGIPVTTLKFTKASN